MIRELDEFIRVRGRGQKSFTGAFFNFTILLNNIINCVLINATVSLFSTYYEEKKTKKKKKTTNNYYVMTCLY